MHMHAYSLCKLFTRSRKNVIVIWKCGLVEVFQSASPLQVGCVLPVSDTCTKTPPLEEPAIGESFRVFVTLVALGNCKDHGWGCGTCTSPEWEDWKEEFAKLKIDKTTRSLKFVSPPDAGPRKHRLDLMGVEDAPRSDSVMPT